MLVSNGTQRSANATTDETIYYRVRFVSEAHPQDTVLLSFTDPAPGQAVYTTHDAEQPPTAEALDILTISDQSIEQLATSNQHLEWVRAASCEPVVFPFVFTLHGAQIIWGHTRAVLIAPADRVLMLLKALVDFAYYDRELRRLQADVDAQWEHVQRDAALAYEVAKPNPERLKQVGRRMEAVLLQHMRFTRLAPRLQQPHLAYSPIANQLLDRMREKTHAEARCEALAAQLEAATRIYEMNSQRISDTKAMRQSRTLEWTIIMLLAAETILIFLDLLWTLEK